MVSLTIILPSVRQSPRSMARVVLFIFRRVPMRYIHLSIFRTASFFAGRSRFYTSPFDFSGATANAINISGSVSANAVSVISGAEKAVYRSLLMMFLPMLPATTWNWSNSTEAGILNRFHGGIFCRTNSASVIRVQATHYFSMHRWEFPRYVLTKHMCVKWVLRMKLNWMPENFPCRQRTCWRMFQYLLQLRCQLLGAGSWKCKSIGSHIEMDASSNISISAVTFTIVLNTMAHQHMGME